MTRVFHRSKARTWRLLRKALDVGRRDRVEANALRQSGKRTCMGEVVISVTTHDFEGRHRAMYDVA
jgi:hypothetical protein